MLRVGSAIQIYELKINISDNGSTEEVKELVDFYKSKYRNISFRRNEVNKGFGINYLNVAEMSSTEYVTFLGDDDGYCDEGMREVIKKMNESAESDKVELYLLNCQATQVPDSLELTGLSFQTYIETLGIFHASFIGHSIIKRQRVVDLLKQRPEVLKSAYPHMYPILDCFNRPNSVRMICDVICLQKDDQRNWRSMQIVYTGIDMPHIIGEYLKIYSVSLGKRIYLVWTFVKSYIRAYFNYRLGIIKLDVGNRYQCPYIVENIKSYFKIIFPRFLDR
jgi:glycosyltransferase involved in cell wall biosynthesis